MTNAETEISIDQIAEQVRKKPALKFGDLELKSRYLVSPLARYTNLSFRRIVRGLGGVGLATTDLVNARALVAGHKKTLQMIRTTPDDSPFAVQIFGHEKEYMSKAAQFLEALDVQSIDINMGCPVERISKHGAGAGLMCKQTQAIELVAAVVESVKIPITVKMRLGWDESELTAPFFAREFEKVGVTAIMIHGRTRAQGFSGTVDRQGIRKVVEAVEKIPVIGNGDMRTIPQVARMFHETGCAGISIGRGALANPWIFRQLVQWEETNSYEPPGNFDDRMDLIMKQYRYLEEQYDSEHALVVFRRTVHWYLKSMRVKSTLRDKVQKANTKDEFIEAMANINKWGPLTGDRTGLLPDMHIPVPSGPIDKW